MGGRGPAPKPAHLRQRTNRKAGATVLRAVAAGPGPDIPNPDGRTWHPLTAGWWSKVWQSPMAAQYLPSDIDGLGRLAVAVDAFNLTGRAELLSEIRLQEARFVLSPLDRSRLQWEMAPAEATDRPATAPQAGRTRDPRKLLRAV